jgi:hypothetical protein
MRERIVSALADVDAQPRVLPRPPGGTSGAQRSRMKRTMPIKKLTLDRTTIRALSETRLQKAQGGMTVILTGLYYIYRSINEGCGSNPQSDDGGCTTQSFSG